MFHERHASVNRNLSGRLIQKYAGDLVNVDWLFTAGHKIRAYEQLLSRALADIKNGKTLSDETTRQLASGDAELSDTIDRMNSASDDPNLSDSMRAKLTEIARSMEPVVDLHDVVMDYVDNMQPEAANDDVQVYGKLEDQE